jgi:hypothetical protein
MNKTIICLAIIIFSTCNAFTQNDSIIATKAFGGYKFEQDGKMINPKTMLKIMENNPEATSYMKKAKTNYDLSMAIGFTGGFLIGWPVGTAIGGGDPNWILAGVGAGILLLAIPTTKAFNENALKAVEIYNSSQRSSYFQNGIQLEFGLTYNGFGLQLIF